MSKAIKYITRVSQSNDDEFGTYLGETISDHEAFTALSIHELEILRNLATIDVEERIKALTKQLKHIKEND